jgi:hypothetical protein
MDQPPAFKFAAAGGTARKYNKKSGLTSFRRLSVVNGICFSSPFGWFYLFFKQQ